MDGKIAAFAFAIVCLTVAVLLLLRVISPLASSAAFAIALATLGGLSRGFRRRSPS